jgi:hypothetical protein
MPQSAADASITKRILEKSEVKGSDISISAISTTETIRFIVVGERSLLLSMRMQIQVSCHDGLR